MNSKYLLASLISLLVCACSADKNDTLETSIDTSKNIDIKNSNELKLEDLSPRLSNLIINNDQPKNRLASFYLGQNATDVPCVPKYRFVTNLEGYPSSKVLSCEIDDTKTNTSFLVEFADNKVGTVVAYVSVAALNSDYMTFRNLLISKYGEPGHEFKEDEQAASMGYNLFFNGVDGINKNLYVQILNCSLYKSIQDKYGVNRYPSGKCGSGSKAATLVKYTLEDISGDQYIPLTDSEYKEQLRQLGFSSQNNSVAPAPSLNEDDDITFYSCRKWQMVMEGHILQQALFYKERGSPPTPEILDAIISEAWSGEDDINTRRFLRLASLELFADPEGQLNYIQSGRFRDDCANVRKGWRNRLQSN